MNASEVAAALSATEAVRESSVILCDARAYGRTSVGYRTGLTLSYSREDGTYTLV